MLLQKKWRNVRLAIRAIRQTWGTELSFRIQVVLIVALLALAAYFHVTRIELALLTLSFSGVLTVELLNTAIERTGDAFGRMDPHIALIKDLGAAAAGTIGLGAIVVTCLIFIPYLKAFL